MYTIECVRLVLLLTVLETGRMQVQAAAGMVNSSQLWNDGEVFYTIDPGMARYTDIIQGAMEMWERHTCLRFLPATPYTKAKITFKTSTVNSCYSHVGRVPGLMNVSLTTGCLTKGEVAHLVGFTLGFIEEHQRPDRDAFVVIKRTNIHDGSGGRFDKASERVFLNISYDYRSIMHARKDYFSESGEVTIETVDPAYQDVIGQRKDLSYRDIRSVQLLYKCAEKLCPKFRPDVCSVFHKEAFLDKNCRCACPVEDFTSLKPCGAAKTKPKTSSKKNLIVVIVFAVVGFIIGAVIGVIIALVRRRRRRNMALEEPPSRQDVYLSTPPAPSPHRGDGGHVYTEINEQEQGDPKYLSIIASPTELSPVPQPQQSAHGAGESYYLTPVASPRDKTQVNTNQ